MSLPEETEFKYYNYAPVVHGNEVYYFGGRHSGNMLESSHLMHCILLLSSNIKKVKQIHRYTVDTNRWRYMGDLQQGRYGWATVALSNSNNFLVMELSSREMDLL